MHGTAAAPTTRTCDVARPPGVVSSGGFLDKGFGPPDVSPAAKTSVSRIPPLLLRQEASESAFSRSPLPQGLRHARVHAALESFANSLGPVEFVTRERYVLLRSNRIFADLRVMSDALRLAIHLGRKAEHRLFTKVGADRKHVTHVVQLQDMEELEAMKPYLREAYEYSIS